MSPKRTAFQDCEGKPTKVLSSSSSSTALPSGVIPVPTQAPTQEDEAQVVFPDAVGEHRVDEGACDVPVERQPVRVVPRVVVPGQVHCQANAHVDSVNIVRL